MGANGTLKSRIIEFFTKNPNRIATLAEILEFTGETDRARVQAAVNNLRKETVSGIDWRESISVAAAGNAWIYRENAKKTNAGTLFELVGKTRTGVLVLQDESGQLYRATEME